MGWAAFNMKRTKTATGEKLGNITVIAPKVTDKFTYDYPYDYVGINILLQYPEYPIEASRFSPPFLYNSVLSYGFGNTLNIREYLGETWTLNNGAKITISDEKPISAFEGKPGTIISWYNPDGNITQGAGQTMPLVSGAVTPPHITSVLPVIRSENLDYDGAPVQEFFINGVKLNSRVYPPARIDKQFYNGALPIIESTDPYDPGGETEPGGGDGDFDETSDPIGFPPIPTASAVDAGFITLFNPTLAELNNLARYMWSDLFSVDGWKKIFSDPMQAILGLSIVPVDVPSTGARPVVVGNISTDISMTVASSQYVAVDCGTLNVNEFWGAYLDYDPYTKAEIYLPYIGTHALATDDIMNKPVHVVYHVDILSGACCAFVKCGDSVLYTFNGQCASSIPITGDNWTNVINGAITIAGAIGTMVATGGMSAPMGVGQIASASVNTLKPSIEKSGSMGGTGGLMAIQTPYLILTRPRQAVPKNQNEFIGYPAYITENLSDLSGYTEIESIHLENVPATSNELSEIESLLKSGVIF